MISHSRGHIPISPPIGIEGSILRQIPIDPSKTVFGSFPCGNYGPWLSPDRHLFIYSLILIREKSFWAVTELQIHYRLSRQSGNKTVTELIEDKLQHDKVCCKLEMFAGGQ